MTYPTARSNSSPSFYGIFLMVYLFLQVLGRQQYIVRPMVMEESCTPGNDNPAIAGSSGIVSEAALAHAPALTERTLREYGISLQQAIEKVLIKTV